MEETKPLRPLGAEAQKATDEYNNPATSEFGQELRSRVVADYLGEEVGEAPFRFVGENIVFDFNAEEYSFGRNVDFFQGGEYAYVLRMTAESGNTLILKVFPRFNDRRGQVGHRQYEAEVRTYQLIQSEGLDGLPTLVQSAQNIALPLDDGHDGTYDLLVITDEGLTLEEGLQKILEQVSTVLTELGYNYPDNLLTDAEERDFLPYASIILHSASQEGGEAYTVRDMYVRQAEALDAFEELGVSHYDVKPSNMTLAGSLIDFGTAKHDDGLYQSPVGTESYIHPLSYLDNSEVQLDKRAIDRYAFATSIMNFLSSVLSIDRFPGFKEPGTSNPRLSATIHDVYDFDRFISDIADIRDMDGEQILPSSFLALLADYDSHSLNTSDTRLADATRAFFERMESMDIHDLQILRQDLSHVYISLTEDDAPATLELDAAG
jgi:hypothetical protein